VQGMAMRWAVLGYPAEHDYLYTRDYYRQENPGRVKEELLGIYNLDGRRLTIAYRKDGRRRRRSNRSRARASRCWCWKAETGSQSKAGRTEEWQEPDAIGRNEDSDHNGWQAEKQSSCPRYARGRPGKPRQCAAVRPITSQPRDYGDLDTKRVPPRTFDRQHAGKSLF